MRFSGAGGCCFGDVGSLKNVGTCNSGNHGHVAGIDILSATVHLLHIGDSSDNRFLVLLTFGGIEMNVFLCYAHENRTAVRKYFDRLSLDKALTVFWDQCIKPGEKWPAVLAKEASQADCMIIFLSSASHASDMVLNEITIAKGRGCRLVPLQLEAT